MPKPFPCQPFPTILRRQKVPPAILCIIGNGFDLHHGIPSRYWDFRDFIEGKDPHLIALLEKQLNKEALWSYFEATLGDIHDDVTEHATQYLVSYGAEDWKDRYNHDYQYEIEQLTSAITYQLKTYFLDWIISLNIPSKPGDHRLNFPKNAKFLNFNYTDTLEKTYRMSSDRILYIHNKAVNADSLLILGHDRTPLPRRPLTAYELAELEDMDPRVCEGERMINNYYASTYKSTDQIISKNESFFHSLRDVIEIHILGHSLSAVDLKYFRIIARTTRRNCIKWKVTYHRSEEVAHHLQTLTRLGISVDRINFYRLTDIYADQLPLF